MFLLTGRSNCCIKEGCSASFEWNKSVMAQDAFDVVVYTFGGTPAAEALVNNAAAKFYWPILDVKPKVIQQRTREPLRHTTCGKAIILTLRCERNRQLKQKITEALREKASTFTNWRFDKLNNMYYILSLILDTSSTIQLVLKL